MRTLLRAVVVFVVAMGLLALVPGVSYGQTSNGTIAGTVTDKTGAGAPGVAVTATSADRGDVHQATTDNAGTYRLESLLPGTYTILFQKGGFSDLKISGIKVQASTEVSANGTIEVSGQATTVLVEASAGQELQMQSGDLSANISQREIRDLPINSLNPIALVLTQPGVQSPSSREDFTNGVGFSVNGTRPRSNNFLIDGQDNNDNAINGQAFQPSNLEAIGEVTILENSYSAQFGRGGGSVTNVISKGGTNTWHGSAFEIHENSATEAIPAELKLTCVFPPDPANPCVNPLNIVNTFGFSIGGPVIHNKLFVFGSPQWQRQRQRASGNTLTLPTANGVATLKAVQPTLSASGQANVQFLLDSLGGLVGITNPATIALGNGRPDVEVGQVTRSGIPSVANDRQEYIRTDWNATDKDTVSARYIRDDSALSPDLGNFPSSLPAFDSQQGGPSQTFGTSWTHTFNPQVVNEMRGSYTQIGFTFGPTGATAANPLSSHALVTIAGSNFPNLGFPSNLPQGRAHTTYQYQDTLSYSFKSHTFRGGADIAHLSVVDAIPFNSRGTFTFNACGSTPGCGGFTSLGNFVDDFTGPSGAVAKVFGSPILKPFVTSYAPFIEDTWRMRSNFTVTLGMRYEYWGTVENVLQFPALQGNLGIGVPGATFPGSFAAPQKSDRNNFAPRVGLAYTPHMFHRLFQDKTVIRAGYGIFYDGLFTNILDNTGAAQPNAVGGSITAGGGRGLPNASAQLNSVQPTLSGRRGITTISGALVNPTTHQWNLDVQREVPGGFIFTVAYVGTRGEHLFVNQEFNPRINFGARVNPAFGPITVRTNGGDSIYHSLQVSAEHRFSKGFLFRGAYTYSKLIDDGSEVFTTSGGSSFAQDPFNQGGDRGLSAFDRRHRFVMTYLWEIPYVHRHDGAFLVVNALTRDWQSAGTITFQTGAPETVNTGFDTLGDGRGGNDRPNLGNPSAPFTSIGVEATPGGEIDDLNTGVAGPASSFHFIIPAAGLGNLGRNTFITPGRQDWNLSVQRTFKFTERQGLMFRTELFNAFNHPNLGINNVGETPVLTLISPSFDNIARTRFGGRTVKFWLRYSF